MSKIVCSIVRLLLLPVGIILVVLLLVMLISHGGQPFRDVGNAVEKTGVKINRCLHRVADDIDRVRKVPEKTIKRIEEFRKGKDSGTTH